MAQPGDSKRGRTQSQISLGLKLRPSPPEIGELERWAQDAQISPLIGVDEAGRGPLAGPVVAAAVSLAPGLELPGLDDSKRLRVAQREHLFDHIREVALAYGVGIVDASSIDSMGILPATFKAMREAIEHAVAGGLQPALVMVDGNLLVPSLALAQRAFVKGDGRSRNIAAASILAKVTRDRMMVEYDAKWPQYGFARHKGYGTSAHMRAIEVAGPCPIHRRSFRPVSEWVEPPAGM